MTEYLIIKKHGQDLFVENENGQSIPIGTQGEHDELRIPITELMDLSFIQDKIDETVTEETAELDEEIISMWKFLGEKNELIKEMVKFMDEKALNLIRQKGFGLECYK